MTDNLKARVRIPSGALTPQENYDGTKKAYSSIKYAYHKLSEVQEQLRAEKNYGASDAIRDAKDELRDAYEYRFVLHSIEQLEGKN